MWSMVYLIGVNHIRTQRKKRGEGMTDSQRKYQSAVASVIQSNDLSLLAEEDHSDYLFEADADSILLEIAKTHQIDDRHLFIDPGRYERGVIGYRSSKRIGEIRPDWPDGSVVNLAHMIVHQFPKREKLWFQKLQNYLERDILFVCGWGHIESFAALLASKEVTYSVLENHIGALPKELTTDDFARRYIKNHPTEFNNPNCPCLV